MKANRERDALRALLDISTQPIKGSKISVHWSLSYAALGLLLATILAFSTDRIGSFSFAGLSFAAGVFTALAYGRYVESVGVRFLAEYLDSKRIRDRYNELVEQIGEGKSTLVGPAKFLMGLLIWGGVAYSVMYLLDKYGNT